MAVFTLASLDEALSDFFGFLLRLLLPPIMTSKDWDSDAVKLYRDIYLDVTGARNNSHTMVKDQDQLESQHGARFRNSYEPACATASR